jgi:hypothetical protein
MPMDPCGQVMDIMRSCYSVDVRPFRDDLTRTCRIRYYFAQPGARPYPGFSPFSSLNWTDFPHGNTGLGEVPGTRRYDLGALPPVGMATAAGCGSTVLRTGALTTDPPLERDAAGTPQCCRVASPCCPGVPLPLTVYVTWGPRKGSTWAPLAGHTYPLSYVGGPSGEWANMSVVIGETTYQMHFVCSGGTWVFNVNTTSQFPLKEGQAIAAAGSVCAPLLVRFPGPWAGQNVGFDQPPPATVTQ